MAPVWAGGEDIFEAVRRDPVETVKALIESQPGASTTSLRLHFHAAEPDVLMQGLLGEPRTDANGHVKRQIVPPAQGSGRLAGARAELIAPVPERAFHSSGCSSQSHVHANHPLKPKAQDSCCQLFMA